MSCTFWLRRKKLAAMQREQEIANATKPAEAEKQAAEKPVKKAGVKKNDEAAS